MGLAQDLKTIVKAAFLLKKYNIVFRFIGNGACKNEIIDLAKPLSDKFFFHDAMERYELIKLIKQSSICLVPLKNKKIFKNALPSKMFEYMSCGRPVIIGVIGEAEKIINESKAGITIEPEDPVALSEAILTYFHNAKRCNIDGKNGMSYITNNLSKEVLISNLIDKLKNE